MRNESYPEPLIKAQPWVFPSTGILVLVTGLAAAIMAWCSGCATGAIGPVSSWNAHRVEKAAARKQIRGSQMTGPRKVEAFALVANDDFIGAGVDLNAIHAWSVDPTSQTLSCTADGLLYGLASYFGIKAVDGSDSDSSSDKTASERPLSSTINSTVTGDGNTLNFNWYNIHNNTQTTTTNPKKRK